MEQLGIMNFPAFLMAGILLNLTPGSDTMYILARSASHGRRAGMLSALGISTGAVIHTTAAACGLSVILASSATAFLLVKYAGALYLVYLGIRAMMTAGPLPNGSSKSGKTASDREIYLSGVLTNVLNPKVALFFLAFLPQFIITDYSHSVFSFLILGLTFITTGTIWCLCLAVFSSSLTKKISRGNASKILHRTTGAIFILMGIHLALGER